MKNKSRERANKILKLYLQKVRNLSFIKSIILVGSLSDDTYTGHTGSDIDLIHIIYDNQELNNTRIQIFNLLTEVERETNYDVPISKNVYLYQDLFHPYRYDFKVSQENKDYIDLPVEVLRIKDTGKVVYGEDIIHSLELPTKEDLIKRDQLSDEMTKIESEQNPEWYETYLKMKTNPTPNILVQIVITNALKDYFMLTGKNCSSKYRILKVINEDLSDYPYLELLSLCHKWRFTNSIFSNEDLKRMQVLYKEWKVHRNNSNPNKEFNVHQNL